MIDQPDLDVRKVRKQLWKLEGKLRESEGLAGVRDGGFGSSLRLNKTQQD
jgi:hypothetical protein